MSICNLTEDQARAMLCAQGASPDFDTSYFVEAGAGAGKTYIIVHRMVKQLLSGACKPEELVAITFTVKSTQELRKRLDEMLLDLWKKATQAGDEGEIAHIQSIRDALGQIQVSTIHSFCQTMIQSMPFEANLGMDIHAVEDDTPYIDVYFRRKLREQPQYFDPVRALSVDPYKLGQAFAQLCRAGDSALAYTPPTDPKITNIKNNLHKLCKDVHGELHSILSTGEANYKKRGKPMKAIFGTKEEEMLEPELATFLKKVDPSHEELLLGMTQMMYQPQSPLRRYGSDVGELRGYLKGRVKDVPDAYIDKQPLYRVMATVEDYKKWDGKSGKDGVQKATPYASIVRPLQNLTHATVMELLVPLVEEYRREKAAEHRLDFNDLLLTARTMLRDSQVAREYFHNRYRVIYVDEFQDTDPVQAEFLFYLTTNEEDFNPDWRQCKPRGGSLFLVGDPKQAIYRFRGADIQIYTQVKTLFEGDPTVNQEGVGQVVILKNNYRSDAVICDLVDRAFDPKSATATSEVLAQSQYQAGYTPMTATRGNTGRGQVSHYMPRGEKSKEFQRSDPKFVARHIATMVENKVEVGTSDQGKHAATYGDFLVLTYSKGAVERYVAALTSRGIPCTSSGDAQLEDAYPVQMGMAHLEAVANPASGLELGILLDKCYGMTLATIRRFVALAKGPLVYTLYNPEILVQVRDQLVDSAEDHQVAELCVIGEELSVLMQKAKTLPPMAVIEWIFDGGFQLWQSAPQSEKREDYAVVQQFLNGIRQGASGCLADYCAYARTYATKGIEYQLQLDETTDCVRVMNLHKAKGLEGNVVILTYNGGSPQTPYSYVHREKNQSTLHTCITNQRVNRYRDDDGELVTSTTTDLYGVPLDWDIPGGWEEKATAFLTAEALRLNYVAATRAETQLIVSGGAVYRGVLLSRWRNIYQQCTQDTKYPNLSQKVPQTATPQAENTTGADTTMVTSAQVVTGVSLNTWEKEQELCTKAKVSGKSSRIAISPSGLDHAAPRPKKKDDYDVDDQDVDANLQMSPPMPQVVKDGEHAPYGADWGTIVHRVMELSIREGCRDTAQLGTYARQAIAETLPNETLTATQAIMLFGKPGTSLTQQAVDWLSGRVAEALAFTADPIAPLNVALASGTPYPELSFFTAVEEGELYDHLSKHLEGALKKESLEGRGLDVQGFIDLAICTDQGWIVVDYKTDRIRTGEDEDSYCARLKEEYTNQIAAYGLLLTQVTGKSIVGSYLCSIPLAGALIPL